jgi:hypothetical protein
MNASIANAQNANAKNARLSFRHTVACVGAMALMTTLAACDKKADGAAGADGGSATTTTATAAAAGKKAKATLKLADLKAAYKSEFDSPSKMRDPMDKKVDAFVAKVGKPASDSGRVKTWYALDGDKCSKVDIDGKDGSITDSTTDKADCGM